MSATLKHEAFGSTDIGQVRTTNQDYFLLKPENHIYIVADGMGGHAGGEVASKLCCEITIEMVAHELSRINCKSHPEPDIYSTFKHAINCASQKIYEKALDNPKLRGMGTTASAVAIIDDHLYYGHVGDSRIYLLRSGLIYQITEDHSLVAEQLKAGLITEKEAELHQLRNVITRTVGYQEEEEVDTGFLKLEEFDKVLICSDGLHGKLTDSEISQTLSDINGLACCNRLITQANIKGGEDNITALVIETSK